MWLRKFNSLVKGLNHSDVFLTIFSIFSIFVASLSAHRRSVIGYKLTTYTNLQSSQKIRSPHFLIVICLDAAYRASNRKRAIAEI